MTTRPRRSLHRMMALCALLLLGAVGVAIWESDWMLERQASQASRVQLQAMADRMPGSVIVQYHLARRLAAAGQEDQAISTLLRAHEIDPSSSRVVALLGDQLERQARFREAGALLQTFTGRHPRDPETHYALGVYYYRVYEHRQAAAVLQETVQLAPGDVRAWRVLGEAKMALGQYQDAIRAYDAALGLAPHDPDTLVRRADAHRILNDLAAAENDLRAACQFAPQNITARYGLAELLARYRSTPEAQREAETMLQQLAAQPNPIPEAHRELGRIYSAQRRWPEAEKELADYLAAKPTDPAGLYLYAAALRHAGKSDRAIIERYRTVQADRDARRNLLLEVQTRPDNLEARLALARYLAAHGEPAFAILTYERVLHQDPRNREARQALAMLQNVMQRAGSRQ